MADLILKPQPVQRAFINKTKDCLFWWPNHTGRQEKHRHLRQRSWYKDGWNRQFWKAKDSSNIGPFHLNLILQEKEAQLDSPL